MQILGYFTSLVQFLSIFGQNNCSNEIDSPKFALGISHKPNIWLMQIFPSTKSRISQGPSVSFLPSILILSSSLKALAYAICLMQILDYLSHHCN